MKFSGRIIRTIGIAAISGMLVVPAMATITVNDSFWVGNGHGPRDGGENDGEGYGPGDCDSIGVIDFTINSTVLLARGGNGNGGGGNGGSGNGPGGGTGDCDGSGNDGETGGNGHGPGDGEGNGGEGPEDGDGYGPGTGDCINA